MAREVKMQSRVREVDWQQVKEWDRKYLIHARYSQQEYDPQPLARTEGSWLYRPDGSKILDFLSGYISVNIGYSHPRIQAAIKEAADSFGFAADHSFATEYRSRVAKLLMEDILGPDDWAGAVRFTVTGSEAVELACIIAKLYTNRPTIVSKEWAYHGYTMGAAGATTSPAYRSGLASDTEPAETRPVPSHPPGGFMMVPGNNCYRCSLGHEYPACKMRDGTLPCVHVVDSMVSARVDSVAAIITDIAQARGTVIPPEEYFAQLRQLTKELGILWIDDEVVCGFGRLGKWFGYQRYGVTPDIMCIGKGLCSSALPVSAVVVSKEIAEFLNKQRFLQLSTFSGHPLAMAAAAANLEVMLEENIPARAAKAGEYIAEKLRVLERNHRCIGRVGGAGVFWSVELVKNRETKEHFRKRALSFNYAGDIHDSVQDVIAHKCHDKGVLLGGFMPNSVILGPPCTVTREEIDIAIDALDDALKEIDAMCD